MSLKDIFKVNEIKYHNSLLSSKNKQYEYVISKTIEELFDNDDVKKLIENDDVYSQLKFSFNNESNHTFMSKLKINITKLIDKVCHLQQSLIIANDNVSQLEHAKYLYYENSIRCDTINLDYFKTNRYKCEFLTYQTETERSDDELLAKFNELINKELIYFEAMSEVLDYCHNKKTKNTSIENQLKKYYLTDIGLDMVNDIIDKNVIDDAID